jgi:hypothetical protein
MTRNPKNDIYKERRPDGSRAYPNAVPGSGSRGERAGLKQWWTCDDEHLSATRRGAIRDCPWRNPKPPRRVFA